MNCRRCGHELKEGDMFCSKCGFPTETIDINSESGAQIKRKATFKDGVLALFSKTFTFKGVSSRREFNFSALFLYLVSILISWISLMPIVNEIPQTNDFLVIYDYILTEMTSTDLSSAINVAAFATTIMYVIFLTAPVFRRTNDIYQSKSISIVFASLFVGGQLLGSNYVITLMGEIYNVIAPLCLILSFGSIFVILMCIFKRGRN